MSESYHRTEGDPGPKTAQEQREAEIEEKIEEIKKHVRKHRTRYLCGVSAFAGAMLMRRYGRSTIVQVIEKDGPEIPESITLVAKTDYLQAILDDPKGAIIWEDSFEHPIPVTLITNKHPQA